MLLHPKLLMQQNSSTFWGSLISWHWDCTNLIDYSVPVFQEQSVISSKISDSFQSEPTLFAKAFRVCNASPGSASRQASGQKTDWAGMLDSMARNAPRPEHCQGRAPAITRAWI